MNLQNIKILNHKKNKGFGLVEIMIALIIVGSIIAAVLWKSMTTMRASDDNKAVVIITDIMSRTNTIMRGQFDKITDSRVIASGFTDAQLVTPGTPQNGIKGPYSLSEITANNVSGHNPGAPDSGSYYLTITHVPKSSCITLVSSWLKTDSIDQNNILNMANPGTPLTYANIGAECTDDATLEIKINS